MLEEPVRNSPLILMSVFCSWVIIVAIMLLSVIGTDEFNLFLIVISILTVITVIGSYFWWKNTTFSANDSEIIRQCNFIYRQRKVVPFAKIASVVVVRTFYDRIFGTSTIQVNINSAKNSTRPEVSFVFKKDMADEVRNYLSSKMFGTAHEAEVEHIYESIVEFTPMDSVLHGLFGFSTFAILGFIIPLAFGLLEIMLFPVNVDILVIAFGISVSALIAIATLIIRYYDFKLYRFGDTIYMSHGAIKQYRTSFKVNRINAIRIKRTLIARLLGKGCIEVEVVGLTSANDNSRPVICIMTKMENVEKIINEILPKFKFEGGDMQPAVAAKIWLARAFYCVLGACVIAICPLWFAFYTDFYGSDAHMVTIIIGCCIAAVAVLAFGLAHLGYKVNLFAMGADTFLIRSGLIDHSTVIMQYDRVQIATLYAWPYAHRLGLARCKIRLLSAVGAGTIVSGFYEKEKLEAVQKEVMDRIRDGRYDYLKLTS